MFSGVFSSARHSRQQQLVDWCGGPNFDGCLIFDECHKAKHFVPVNINCHCLIPGCSFLCSCCFMLVAFNIMVFDD